MEGGVLSEDHLPKFGAPCSTGSQTWDLMPLPKDRSQRFCCHPCQWHPCA